MKSILPFGLLGIFYVVRACATLSYDGLSQNCLGKYCGQDSLWRMRRAVVTEFLAQEEIKRGEDEVDVGRGARSLHSHPQSVGRRKRSIVQAVIGLAEAQAAKIKKESDSDVHSCVGSLCSLKRRKREVGDEEHKITEKQLEEELKEDVIKGAGYRSVFHSIRAYLRGLFLLPDAQFNLRYLSSNKPSKATPAPLTPTLFSDPSSSTQPSVPSHLKNLSPHILECSGPITSFCKNRVCRVKCIDGRKVSLLLLETSLILLIPRLS